MSTGDDGLPSISISRVRQIGSYVVVVMVAAHKPIAVDRRLGLDLATLNVVAQLNLAADLSISDRRNYSNLSNHNMMI